MELAILIIPLFSCGLFWLAGSRRAINVLNVISAGAVFLTALPLAAGVTGQGAYAPAALNGLLYADAISVLILLITTFIFFLISIYSVGYMNVEFDRGQLTLRKLRVYYSLLHVFAFTMLLTALARNMGVIWIAIEGTTLASAFLVGFYNSKKTLEAAWKYIIICSVGIAFALLGIVLLYYSSVHSLGESSQGLNWHYLMENAAKLDGSVLKIAFIFVLVGFGTKAGLAPMHTWLPDAHSQAPSPVSALLSGVLLNTAMYGVIRVMIIVNRNLGSSIFAGRLLMALGLLSAGTAAVFIMVQHDYKRILAYSSIEHMGIISFGFGVMTPLCVLGSLLHMLNHSLTKSMLFASAGRVYLKYETRRMQYVKGIMKTMPVTGTVFLLGIFAITGMPPFSIFVSKLYIITGAFQGSKYLQAALMLLFVALVFAGFITGMIKMFYGEPVKIPGEAKTETAIQAEAGASAKAGDTSIGGTVVLITLLILIAVQGIYQPAPLKALLESARILIMGA